MLEEINVGDIVLIGENGIFKNNNLQTIEIGKNCRLESRAISDNSTLRSITIGEGMKQLPELAFAECPALNKISLPSTISTLDENALQTGSPWYEPKVEGQIMFLDLLGLEKTGESSIGQFQAMRVGNSYVDPFGQNGDFNSRWIDWEKNKNSIICFMSPIPPAYSPFFGETYNDCTLYVPEEGVENYKKLWNCTVLPITDMLIPLVSEKSLTIVEGNTYNYLWDVLPLGDAVVGENLHWESENPEIAQIDERGVLIALKFGETKITFSIEDTNGNPFTTESHVKVDSQGPIKPGSVEEYEGDQAPIGLYSDGIYDLTGRYISNSIDNVLPGLYIQISNSKASKIHKTN